MTDYRELKAQHEECRAKYIAAAFSIRTEAVECKENWTCHFVSVAEWRAALGEFRQCANVAKESMLALASACKKAEGKLLAACKAEVDAIEESSPHDEDMHMIEAHGGTLDVIESMLAEAASPPKEL